jgi:hypothetical protein
MAIAVAAPTATRAEIVASLSAAATPVLAERLLSEYEELTRRYYHADYRPSELSGGRFGEAGFRVCEHACLGAFTPLQKMLPKTDDLVKKLEQVPATVADSAYRIHIPRALRLIYDLRSKRDVAHLGAGVSPNFADASLVLQTASWVVAEIVRLSHKCDIDTAQAIVDDLVQRRVPLIWIEDDIVRVLKPTLKYSEKALVILYHFHPEWIADDDLMRWIEESRLGNFNRMLDGLHARALIHRADRRSKILPPGLKYVEDSPELRHV